MFVGYGSTKLTYLKIEYKCGKYTCLMLIFRFWYLHWTTIGILLSSTLQNPYFSDQSCEICNTRISMPISFGPPLWTTSNCFDDKYWIICAIIMWKNNDIHLFHNSFLARCKRWIEEWICIVVVWMQANSAFYFLKTSNWLIQLQILISYVIKEILNEIQRVWTNIFQDISEFFLKNKRWIDLDEQLYSFPQ